MKKGFVVILLIFINNFCTAQKDSIQARIVVIGDAGELNFGREPVVNAARDSVIMNEKTTVLYVGDNLYNYGLPDEVMPTYAHLRAILDSQINIAKGTKAKVIFIPGNHDWSNEAPDGLAIVKRQADYIAAKQDSNVHFFPADGCPGPVEYEINKDIELVMYDSQWFIRKPGTKPGIESDCPYKTEDQFYNELDDILNRNSDKLVILAGHHTLKSYGIHGGFFKLKQYIFPLTDMSSKLWIPLPIIGIAYPIARGVFGTPEDLKYPAYANMIDNIERVVQKHPNVIFVGGHEHTLQLIKDSSYYYIVSGAGSKHTRVSHSKKTLFEQSSLGFASLEISKNKNVHVDFYTVDQDSVRHAYSHNLFNFSTIKKEPSDSATKIPEATPIISFKDSVTVAANTQYGKISSLHKFFGGRNYRKEWGTPVHLKVFRVDKEKGGFKIGTLGGGKQTKSLSLTDKEGREWTLRTVDKDPEGVITEQLKSTVPFKLIQDMISAEHPYAALAVPSLADAASIVHPVPEYFFVPDDPALGLYRTVFANKVCLLEMKNPTIDQNDIKSSAKVIDNILKDSKNHIDQEAVLRARLLDMMIGDWDRHPDQWKFGTNDTGTGKLYYPIPKDRDEAFFNSDGLFVRSLTVAALPYLQGFKKRFLNIKWFNWEERDFDRIFMNNLDENAWKRIIASFHEHVTDTVINESIQNFPPEIYALDKKTIPEKLKSRRDLLSKVGLKYYNFLAKEVNVVGSNKNEYFKVFNSANNLEVKVYKRKTNTDSSSVMFDRVFDSKATKFVNLYGLNGDDIFEIDSTANSKIRLRIIGGKGRDTFNIHGNVRNKIFDFKLDSNYVQHSSKTNNQISSDPQVNNYDITGFNYNTYRIPLLNISFNEEDKLLLGLGYSLKTYGFRKDPFSTYQRISSLYSFKTSAYQVNYSGEFNQLLGKNDLVVNAQLYNSVLNNFYGLGNETKKDKSKNSSFYNVRYNYFSAEMLMRKRIFNVIQLNVGPAFYHYWNHYYDNKEKILAQPLFGGFDSASIYSGKSYFGGKASIVVNNLNADLMPTRGVYWNTEFSSLFGVNSNSRQITKLTSDMTVYSSLNDPTRLVAVLRIGYGHIFSENYEYFEALTLGSDNYLRGFRKDRFSGKSLLYQSLELRWKLFDSKSYIVPGAVGLIGFNDVGRVWVKTETSHKWHDSFGGGFYYSPYNFALVSATIAFSGEGSLYNFSIGTKFNITF
jgi:hypothetical protein